MPYSLDASTDSCYDGTTCLINKLGIRDDKVLERVEAEITFAKSVLLERNSVIGNFDFEHFKEIHKFLFSDLYDFAGEIRTVDISKKRTRFLSAGQIEQTAEKLFSKVASGVLDDLPFDEFVKEIATLYNEVNFLHPFREGNGRTQRIYFTQLIRKYGYDINFSDIDTDFLMIATIQASGGVLDFLIEFFKESIVAKAEDE